jgi:hypothetical protein
MANRNMKSPLETKFQVAILAEIPNHIGSLTDTDSIEWLYCKQSGDSLFDFYKGSAIISSINLDKGGLDLPNLLGMVLVGGVESCEAIKRNWSSRLPAAGLAFRQIPEAETKAILGAALECLADVLTLHRCHSGRAILELAAYRREFERLQHNFVRLEEFVGRRCFERPTEIFEYAPDSVSVAESTGGTRLEQSDGATSRSLTQYLPVDSLGISSFSIHISAQPDAGAEPLHIELKAIETGHVFGAWSIAADQVRIGWVELSLEQAIGEPALSLVVIVEWPRTGLWALTLGSPHPYKEFCACTEAGEYLRAPLSLRIFNSLPGTRVAATTTALRPIDAPLVPVKFIPYEVYENVIQVSPPVQENAPALVSYDREIGCITVHPCGGTPTIARMDLAVPQHSWGLSAQIHLAHERASPTQFGLIACAPRNEGKELAQIGQIDAPSRTFSGWKTLSALDRKTMTLLLAPSPDERLSVYLLTRQAPGVSPDFAWARFSKLEFNVLPKSQMVDNQRELAMVGAEGRIHRQTPQE